MFFVCIFSCPQLYINDPETHFSQNQTTQEFKEDPDFKRRVSYNESAVHIPTDIYEGCKYMMTDYILLLNKLLKRNHLKSNAVEVQYVLHSMYAIYQNERSQSCLHRTALLSFVCVMLHLYAHRTYSIYSLLRSALVERVARNTRNIHKRELR